MDDTDTNGAVLRELKKELGLDPDQPLHGEAKGMNVREAIEDAVIEHQKHNPSGFTKGA